MTGENVMARFETSWDRLDGFETGWDRVDGFETCWWTPTGSNLTIYLSILNLAGRTLTWYWPASKVANLCADRSNSWLRQLERISFILLFPSSL